MGERRPVRAEGRRARRAAARGRGRGVRRQRPRPAHDPRLIPAAASVRRAAKKYVDTAACLRGVRRRAA
ncbi:Adenosylhomocysteinase [Nocardioides sp. AX2bis]|nr:Adenosylhomocysteinase [Nocardioides sp. AX2bis]